MAAPLSADLRSRMVRAVEVEGVSRRGAAGGAVRRGSEFRPAAAWSAEDGQCDLAEADDA